MAVTAYGVNNALTVKLWAKKLNVEALRETWASRFMGEDSGSIIQVRTETKKGPGDRVTIGLRAQLQGNGVIGDGTLEGQEEALSTYTDNVFVDQLRHAVRSQGRMSQQRVPFSIREENLSGLRDWWADRIDWAFLNQACGNTAETRTQWTGNQATIAPDSKHIINPSATSSVHDEDIGSSNTFSLTLIDRCVERAKTLTIAADGTPPIRPVRINGGQYYVMILHPYAVYDMRTSGSTAGQWYDIQKALMTGGVTKDNPVFTGALGIYNGTILHADVRVPQGINSSTAAGITTVRRNVFLGAQALACAYGQDNGENKMTWVEELFDYENQLGVSSGMIYGMKKLVYNSRDYATIVASSYSVSH